MKLATICFLAGFLQADLGFCIRDDERPQHFVMNGSEQSDVNDTSEGVVITANELRTISAFGDTMEHFEKKFDEQVNKMYREKVETTLSETINHGSSSFVDTSGNPTNTFCPAKWLPMLAEQGTYVAEGQYGEVYTVKVECEETSPTVAVKYETQRNPHAKREIIAGITFDHAHVVKFYDYDKIQSKTVILMEAVSGGDLSKNRKDLNDKDLSKYVLEILYGLKHIHDKDFVHADFKPDQVMLTCKSGKKCHAKLGDFGFTDKEGVKEIRGTPLYFSPELVLTKKLSKTADMWAFGVSLFEMTHQGNMPSYLAKATSIPALNQIMYNMYTQENYFSKHTVANPSPIDTLITGLLQVNVNNRMTVDQAIAAAKTWAKLYYTSNDIAAMASNDVSKRAGLPPCWTACKDQCHGRQCKVGKEDLTPTCSNPTATNVKTKTVTRGTVDGYEEVSVMLYRDITPYIKLDQDARIMTALGVATQAGLHALDIIVQVHGQDIVHALNVQPAFLVVSMLNILKTYNTYPAVMKVLRRVQKIQQTPQIQLNYQPVRTNFYSRYTNYPYGAPTTLIIYK